MDFKKFYLLSTNNYLFIMATGNSSLPSPARSTVYIVRVRELTLARRGARAQVLKDLQLGMLAALLRFKL
jgi:hypothetical protein